LYCESISKQTFENIYLRIDAQNLGVHKHAHTQMSRTLPRIYTYLRVEAQNFGMHRQRLKMVTRIAAGHSRVDVEGEK